MCLTNRSFCVDNPTDICLLQQRQQDSPVGARGKDNLMEMTRNYDKNNFDSRCRTDTAPHTLLAFFF